MNSFKKLLKEPLFHFLILGALIFAIYSWVPKSGNYNTRELRITQNKIQNLSELFTRTWQRPPTQKELQGLIDNYIREEVLYREGIQLGLDKNDTWIRRRIGQKMDFLIEDNSNQAEASETQLKNFYQENLDSFLVEPRFYFRQIYLNDDLRGKKLNEDALALLNNLNKAQLAENWESLGDPSLLNHRYEDMAFSELKTIFGEEFADQFQKIPLNQWAGPIPSAYGSHLVWIGKREDQREPAFEEVREKVEREWSYRQRENMKDRFFQGLRKNYEVIIEEPSLAPQANLPEGQND